ncbi:PucR C-terminal helix-turn-helix domain-containing protein [Actinokineospora alba]|uniref:PucR C-terminal helix-turn-helix domain-containing protein n=1 Tax=Actinokineospora alba TaxID=504798 RepID=A0A1H0G3Q6_9PSEU|nr:PucR family transcriptional regulator [Actinokineospora alba]TDP69748.1 PucR-like helix-turn-helix protein [Actinokineospora alba]SDI09609.1 PucR C-terminal helix-turn-helix domain-containing protein [Actinokineospora alba]SDO01516.1 PucR C-terminal helix-turn-helix domain-containing protein [Actinokineospora alba]
MPDCVPSAPLALLQQAVDSLSTALARPAVIEGPGLDLLAHSAHHAAGDQVRQQSIMSRRATPEVARWLVRQGVFDAGHALRVPACGELHMLPRVCVPVRSGDTLRGFVWFIDADEPMSDAEVALAELAVGGLAGALDGLGPRRNPPGPVEDLLGGDDVTRTRAARAIGQGAGFPDAAGVVALVAAVVGPGGAFIAGRSGPGPVRTWPGLHVREADHEVLFLPTGKGDAVADRFAGLLAETVGTRTDGRPVVGVGQPRPRLQDARDSLREAIAAARVAARVPELGTVVRWSGLGIYRVLSGLSDDALSEVRVHPGLERLFADHASLPLLETLETYLDLGGNAPMTAARLHLHRATLYYRLRRIEELTKSTLKDGGERLSLHAALKLGRLAGRYPPAPAGIARATPGDR